jgi:hypothetical protein
LKPLLDLSERFRGDSALGRGLRRDRALFVVAESAQAGSGPFDRVALVVQQVANLEQQLDVAPLVEALLRAGLLGLDRLELGLPVAKDVGLDAAQTRRFADLEVGLVRDP